MSLLNRLKNKMWLTQRVTLPKNYVNPFGVASMDVQSKLKDIFDVEYMGAAEYEHGKLDRYINKMIDNAMNLRVYGHHLRLRDVGNYNLADIEDTEILCKIYIIANNAGPNGCDSDDSFYKAFTGINYLLNTSWGKTKKEVSKNDNGSFYYNVISSKGNNLDYPYSKTMGWLPLESDFAWFVDQDMANKFLKRLREFKREEILDNEELVGPQVRDLLKQHRKGIE